MKKAGTHHFLALEGLSRPVLEELLAAAERHKRAWAQGALKPLLAGKLVANVFFEDSTRTRSSFEIAAKLLGAEVLNWTTRGGSVSKGETLLDTVRNLDSMGLSAMVIRHSSSGAPLAASQHVRCAVINAGDGSHEHPSQGLLDAFTLRERLGSLEGKTVVIVGDVLHSRVARSNAHCLTQLGAKVVLCGPPTLLPVPGASLGCEMTYALDPVLERADAVLMLRLQAERQTDSLIPSHREYARLYGLNVARAEKLKPHAVVLHPGPMNRGVEIASEVADGERSVILDQVKNGVAVRMAILEACA